MQRKTLFWTSITELIMFYPNSGLIWVSRFWPADLATAQNRWPTADSHHRCTANFSKSLITIYIRCPHMVCLAIVCQCLTLKQSLPSPSQSFPAASCPARHAILEGELPFHHLQHPLTHSGTSSSCPHRVKAIRNHSPLSLENRSPPSNVDVGDGFQGS